MGRRARSIIPGVPYHVTQRGNFREPVFVDDEDRWVYLRLVLRYGAMFAVRIHAYCLMLNHIHFLLEAAERLGIAQFMRSVQKKYSDHLNERLGRRGHTWQDRFFSAALDDEYYWKAMRYVERNPVRAGIVERAELYPWSSAAGHCGLVHDPIICEPRSSGIENWDSWLANSEDPDLLTALRRATKTGRAVGAEAFLSYVSEMTGQRMAFDQSVRPPWDRKGDCHHSKGDCHLFQALRSGA